MKKSIIHFLKIGIASTILVLLSSELVAQNIGVNTETPQARLHIFKGSSGYVGVYPHQDLIIESNDNAWINLLAPNNKEMGLLFGKPSNIASGGIVYDINNNMHFRTNGNVNRMFIGSNGNVGIGNTTPNAPLSFPAVLGSKITLYPGASGNVGFGVQGNLFQMFSDHVGADIAFGYGSSNSFNERMRIKGTGNVGIGTSNPISRLHVAGDIRAAGIIYAGQNVYADAYYYNTAKTSYYSVPVQAYKDGGIRVFEDGAYIENININYFMQGGINLPHQAHITQLKIGYTDVSSSSDIIVELYRNYFTGGAGVFPELMSSFTSSGTPGDWYAVINNINNPVVDNYQYSYFLKIRAVTAPYGTIEWPSDDLQIKTIIITYTLSSVQ